MDDTCLHRFLSYQSKAYTSSLGCLSAKSAWTLRQDQTGILWCFHSWNRSSLLHCCFQILSDSMIQSSNLSCMPRDLDSDWMSSSWLLLPKLTHTKTILVYWTIVCYDIFIMKVMEIVRKNVQSIFPFSYVYLFECNSNRNPILWIDIFHFKRKLRWAIHGKARVRESEFVIAWRSCVALHSRRLDDADRAVLVGCGEC